MNNINILLVDDVDLVLESTSNFLKREFNVFTASNGMEAWNVLETQKIDCLVTDVDMPVMNGIELIKKMKKNNCDVKTIVISGNYDQFDNELYTDLEVDARFIKPYLPNNLTRTIKTLLES